MGYDCNFTSGSATKILQRNLLRSIAHILKTYRPSSPLINNSIDHVNNVEVIETDDKKTEDPFEEAQSKITNAYDKRQKETCHYDGYTEVDEGVLETLTGFSIHLIGTICKKASSLASHRNQTTNVIDILMAYYELDPESAGTMGSARRDKDGNLKYLDHLNSPPLQIQVDSRMEAYENKILGKYERVHSIKKYRFPGSSPPQCDGPNTLYGMMLEDCSRRFYFSLCLDVIRAIVGVSAAHVRKFQGSSGGSEDLSHADLDEWGLDEPTDTKVDKSDNHIAVTPVTINCILHAISGSEEALQNLISHEVCQLMPHNSTLPRDNTELYDPVSHFCDELEFLSPHMAAMIRTICYRVVIDTWSLMSKIIHDRLMACRLNDGITPYPVKRLSRISQDSSVPQPSLMSFIPFAKKVGLTEYIEQPEPGGSVLGRLYSSFTSLANHLDEWIIQPGMLLEETGDKVGSKSILQRPSNIPIYAPPTPSIDLYGQRLLVDGCPQAAQTIMESWRINNEKNLHKI